MGLELPRSTQLANSLLELEKKVMEWLTIRLHNNDKNLKDVDKGITKIFSSNTSGLLSIE